MRPDGADDGSWVSWVGFLSKVCSEGSLLFVKLVKYSQLILYDSLYSLISSISPTECFLFLYKILLALHHIFKCLVNAQYNLIWHVGKSLEVTLVFPPVLTALVL